MIVAHLTASTFYGGPERQMLGLARELKPGVHSVFLSFSEGGRCRSFLDQAVRQRFVARELTNDTPWLRAAVRELTDELELLEVDVLCCHGYKADLLGRLAARLPRHSCGGRVARLDGGEFQGAAVRIARPLEPPLDGSRRLCLTRPGCQARRAGADPTRLSVIHNAIDPGRFADPDLRYLRRLHEYFPRPRRSVIGSAGRLSPEKGFDVLVKAAALVIARDPSLGFIHFGDGPDHDRIADAIESAGLRDVFLLAGLTSDLDRYYPFFDLLVLPSYTEGLPNVVLEAFAARVPVVATAVGGTPEVVEEGVSGFLVPPGNAVALAERILAALTDEDRRLEMGRRGYERVCTDFTFAAQARAYARLFAELAPGAALHESSLVEQESMA